MLVPREVFKVSKAAAPDSTRYAVHGVLVQRDKDGTCRAVTTDGRRLALATWSDDQVREDWPPLDVGSTRPVAGFETILPVRDWDQAGKNIPKRTNKAALKNCLVDETSANGKVDLVTTDCETHQALQATSIDGHFPKYQDVMPDYIVGEDAVEIGCDPKFLADAARMVGDMTNDAECRLVRLVVPTNPDRPFKVTARNATTGVECTNVIMPMNLRTKEEAKRPAHSTAVTEAQHLARIAEALVNVQYIEEEDTRADALAKVLRDADDLLDTMHYLTVRRSEYPGMAWPVGLTDVARVSPECRARLDAEYEAQKTDQADESAEVVDDILAGIDLVGDDQPDTTDPVDEALAGVDLGTPDPVTPKKTTTRSRGVKVQANDRRVSVRNLRKTGERCGTCGVSTNRGKFRPADKWRVLNGTAYCPACEDGAA